MKKFVFVTLAVALGMLAYFFFQFKSSQEHKDPFSTKDITFEENYKIFSDSLGKILSGGKYDTLFENGNLGKYAISNICLRDLGVDPDLAFNMQFLKDSMLQEEAFKGLCMLNKYRLRNYIDSYDGKMHRGIEITESGMIAGAHLVGATALKMWFLDKYDNTELTLLMQQLNGYDMEYIAPVHTYKIN